MYPYAHLDSGFEHVESGLAEMAYIAAKRDMETIATPQAPFVNPGDQITVFEDHTFPAGKGFIKVQLAPQKNELDYNSKGDPGNLSQSAVLKIFIPGSKIQVHEQVRAWANEGLIVLTKDPECDPANARYYQLGCDCTGAWLSKNDWKSYTTKDGSKGFILEIIYDGGPLFYKGALTLKP